ncbi:MAG: restriction endonuclease FokI C-terminal domain-containing protein [bacterium]|nr:restriction endonuclease FokI C-terminal domain-containing protein [bacterium]
MQLSLEQEKELGLYLKDFQKSQTVEDNNVVTAYASFDDNRIKAIEELKKMVSDFLGGSLSMTDFKEKSETMSRTFPHWGFKGFSGQMQLNQYVNNIEDSAKEKNLKEALSVPKSMDEAVAKIDTFAEYLTELKTKTDNPKSIPRVNQSFMLSYFWELQAPELYPVFFGSAKNVLENLGFDFKSQETAGVEFKYFTEIYSAIRSLFEKENVNEKHPVWYVEHVLWNEFKKQHVSTSAETKTETKQKSPSVTKIARTPDESWIPPVIADLENLALNQETEWTQKRGIKPEKAFETKLRYLFTILGYNVTELGQGKGREPDGIAISTDGHAGYYAIIYDAKAREKDYSIGTGDREITEYIKNKQRELQRQRVDKVSFLIVSSEFANSPSLENSLKDIYRATRVPIILVKAKDLLDIVNRKLSNADIDHAQLEDLFLETGILTAEKIVDVLG